MKTNHYQQVWMLLPRGEDPNPARLEDCLQEKWVIFGRKNNILIWLLHLVHWLVQWEIWDDFPDERLYSGVVWVRCYDPGGEQHWRKKIMLPWKENCHHQHRHHHHHHHHRHHHHHLENSGSVGALRRTAHCSSTVEWDRIACKQCSNRVSWG